MLSNNLSSLMDGKWSNLCTADLNDVVGLISCERTLCGQTVLLSVDSVVFGCHREMVGEEMERVEELGKVGT